MTTQTMNAAAGAPILGDLARGFARFVAAIAAGQRASHDWRRLSAMSDAALAREGIARDRVARAVMERNFG